MVSIQVLATPIRGLVRSSPVKPMALNMARDGARSRPSVIRRLRCFGSIGLRDYDSKAESESVGGASVNACAQVIWRIMRRLTMLAVLVVFLGAMLLGEKQEIVWSDQEKSIYEQI